VREHGPAQAHGDADQPLPPGLVLSWWLQLGEFCLQDRFGERVDQFGLVADVPVQGRRLDAEPLGEPSQRHAVKAALVQQCAGLGDDPFLVQRHAHASLPTSLYRC
jgi:hypothetical protein